MSLVVAPPAIAQEPDAPWDEEPEQAEEPETGERLPTRTAIGGYVETYYAWNFNRPVPGVTWGREPDDRHNAFTLQNAVLDGRFSHGRVSGRIALQSGSMPSNDAETLGTGSPSGREQDSWRFLQQAILAYRALPTGALLLEGGIHLWPVGPESIAVHQQWNWSRSNLFHALPARQAGVRATYRGTGAMSTALGVSNGWRVAQENNDEKSLSAEWSYHVPEQVTVTARYLGGVERDAEAPEGRPWRHVVDTYVRVQATDAFAFLVEANGGLENTAFGRSWWAGGAVYARLQPLDPVYVAVRVDGLRQLTANGDAGAAETILFPGPGVVSGTATVDVRPADGLSVRLEYRHDQGGTSLFFRGEVLGTGSSMSPYEPNSYRQDTVLVGGTAWF